MSTQPPTDRSSRQLDQAIEQLPRAVQPQRDLWPEIEARLADRQAPAWSRLAVAASLVAALLLGWQLERWLPADSLARSQLAFVDILYRQHLSTRQQVLQQYQQVDARDPQMLLPTKTALEEVRQAQELLHQALQQEPKNAELIKMLQWLQQRELELIRKQHQPRWRRT